MGVATMGRVVVEAKVVNLKDAWDAERGRIPAADVRTITVPDALVDSGATLLALPPAHIQALGLEKTTTKRSRTVSGIVEATLYDAVRLTVQGRDCVVEVMGLPEGMPTLIGQLPLRPWFVIDMRAKS